MTTTPSILNALANADPLPALAGGALIGAAAGLLLLFNGRIAGVSGMVKGLFAPAAGNIPGRLLFLAGLVVGAGIYGYWSGQLPQAREHFPGPLLLLAGILVGLGTAKARGCTSGHGVCGLARFSPRSLIAVAIFLASAIVTTYLVRHLWHIA